MERYFAFYKSTTTGGTIRAVCDSEDAILALVRKVNDPESEYRDLVVIYGEELQFEPIEKVTAWRIKETG